MWCVKSSSLGLCREVSFDSSWVPPWLNQGMDVAGTSSGIRSGGLNGVQMLMRQLSSVSDNYAHGSLDDASWILWPNQPASGASAPPSSSLRYTRNTAGLQFRNATPTVNGNMSEILAMVDRVREVLPHIPDELIIQVCYNLMLLVISQSKPDIMLHSSCRTCYGPTTSTLL